MCSGEIIMITMKNSVRLGEQVKRSFVYLYCFHIYQWESITWVTKNWVVINIIVWKEEKRKDICIIYILNKNQDFFFSLTFYSFHWSRRFECKEPKDFLILWLNKRPFLPFIYKSINEKHGECPGSTQCVWGVSQCVRLCSFMLRHCFLPIKGGITTSDLDCFHFQTAAKCQHKTCSLSCSLLSHKRSLEPRPIEENRCRQALFWQHWKRLWLGVRIA